MSAPERNGPVVESLDHEVKFALAASLAGPASALLDGVCARERHARSRVGTIYFDDRALDSAHEKWASDYRKTKVRLRWYDGAGTVHLEIKRRIGSRREKLRFETAIPGADLESGGLGAAEQADVGALLSGLGIEAPPDLAPALRLAYSRDRFVDRHSDCRLSLDTSIAAIERAPWCAATGLAAATHGELDLALVECKGASRDLPPLVAALAALGARRTSFSKYNACLTHGIHV
jgi:hypothetical protein